MLKLLSIPRSGIRPFSTFKPLRNEPVTLGSLLNQSNRQQQQQQYTQGQGLGQLQQEEIEIDDQYKRNNTKTQIKRTLPPRLKTLKYILHANFGKNNTIMTLSSVSVDLNHEINNPELGFNEKVLYYLNLPQKAIFSKSTGMIGFNKSARGEYESAYQLSSFVFNQIETRKLLSDPKTNAPFEIRVKNYGSGRKGFFDCLLGKEGNSLVPHITKLSDYTKIKFGGVRSPKVRRV